MLGSLADSHFGSDCQLSCEKEGSDMKKPLLIFILFLWVAITSCATNVKWPGAKAVHSSSVEAMWVHSNMYSKTNSQPLLAYSNETIIFLGSDDRLGREKIVALDALTGDIVWEIDSPNGVTH